MAATRIAAVLACGSDHVSAIETGTPLAANRHTIDAAFLSQLMTPASIGNDALAYLIKTYQRAHQCGELSWPLPYSHSSSHLPRSQFFPPSFRMCRASASKVQWGYFCHSTPLCSYLARVSNAAENLNSYTSLKCAFS